MIKPKLLDEVRNVARLKHLSLSAEKSYVSFNWRKSKASSVRAVR